MGRRAKTKNGYDVSNLRQCERGIFGSNWTVGILNCSQFPYVFWNMDGKADYVHNLGNYEHIEEFDLFWIEL